MKENPPLSLKEIATARYQALKSTREFFDRRAYIEIDAPTLIEANAVESHIDPLSTIIQVPEGCTQTRAYLMTSPEIHMKRLLSSGLHKIYFLGHVFRDRESSPIHRTEFTMLEWYTACGSLDQMISECEQLFSQVTQALIGTTKIAKKGDQELDLGQGFERLSMADAWAKYANIDLISCLEMTAQGDQKALIASVIARGEALREDADFEDAFAHIMLKYIEPQIGKNVPCVLFDWPAQTAALARLNPGNLLLAQRFEIYCGGLELANAFAELTDSQEQKRRFIESNRVRELYSRSVLPISEVFLKDLEKMPPSCGIAVGIDRLIALILGKEDLREVTCLSQEIT